jgi:LacI family transcriptional regulator
VATIYDVAREAGVSPATVSRVLNGRVDVSPTLTARVRAAMAELDYRPNGVARNLRRRATTVWGLIISDIGNPFFTAVVRGVEDAALDAGYSLMLCNSDDDLEKERRYIEIALDEQLAGIIVSPASEAETDLTALVERGIPVVAIDRVSARHDLDAVLADNARGARLATQELLETGCQRIACITGPTRTTTAAQRLEGFRQAHELAGLDIDPNLVIIENFKEDGGRDGAERLLELGTPPDGLFVANNLMTVGALERILDAGVDIPGDLGVVGFDDIPWARLTRPRLTTIEQPTYNIGHEAGRLLAERMTDPDRIPRTLVLPSQLRVRESTRG